MCLNLLQAISEELVGQEERLERSRLAASELGRSIAMSPVVVDVSIVVGTDATSATMPVSLASSADHVAQQLQLLQQSINVLADMAEKQSSAVNNCNGAILTAEKLINTARQVTNDGGKIHSNAALWTDNFNVCFGNRRRCARSRKTPTRNELETSWLS